MPEAETLPVNPSTVNRPLPNPAPWPTKRLVETNNEDEAFNGPVTVRPALTVEDALEMKPLWSVARLTTVSVDETVAAPETEREEPMDEDAIERRPP